MNEPTTPTPARTGNTRFLPVFAILLLLNLHPWKLSAETGIKARGTIAVGMYNLTNSNKEIKERWQFEITRVGKVFRGDLSESNATAAKSERSGQSYTIQSNGTESTTFITLSEGAAPQTSVAKVVVGPLPVLENAALEALWLTFASESYFKQQTNNRCAYLNPLRPPLTSLFAPEAYSFKAVFRSAFAESVRLISNGTVPVVEKDELRSIPLPAPFDKGYEEGLSSIDKWISLPGGEIPKSSTLEFSIPLQPEGKSAVVGTPFLSVNLLTESGQFTSDQKVVFREIDRKTVVEDFRSRSLARNVTHLVFSDLTNGIPKTNDASFLKPLATAEAARSTKATTGGPIPKILFYFFAGLSAVFLFRQLRKERSEL